MLLIYVFDYMIMADKNASDSSDQTEEASGLGMFFTMGVTDINLVCVFIHGIFTRITFIGFFYFSLPILLKTDYTYADIGRMMMFYSVPSVLFGRCYKQTDQENRTQQNVRHRIQYSGGVFF